MKKKSAFTLSEVMVTITLIGFLASLTLTTVGNSVQKKAIVSEFRTAYSKMESVLKNISVDEGKIYSCYALPTDDDKTLYGLNMGGAPVATSSECAGLERAFTRAMGATRSCTDALTEGCLPSNYPKPAEGCFQDYTKSHAYVLDNSMIIFTDDDTNGLKLFAIDVTGRKGPNRWGQDIFPFTVRASESVLSNGRTHVTNLGFFPPDEEGCVYASGAGVTTTSMMKKSVGLNE